jgi:hypothetical protein
MRKATTRYAPLVTLSLLRLFAAIKSALKAIAWSACKSLQLQARPFHLPLDPLLLSKILPLFPPSAFCLSFPAAGATKNYEPRASSSRLPPFSPIQSPASNIQHSIAADPASARTIPRRPGLWRDKTGLSIAPAGASAMRGKKIEKMNK